MSVGLISWLYNLLPFYRIRVLTGFFVVVLFISEFSYSCVRQI